MNVQQKSLFAAGLVLLIQVAFLVFLSELLQQAELELSRESRERAIVNEVMHFYQCATKAALAIYVIRTTDSDWAKKMYDEDSKRIVHAQLTVHSLIPKEHKDAFKNVEDYTRLVLETMEGFRSGNLDPQMNPGMLRETRTKLLEGLDSIDKLTDMQKQRLAATSMSMQKRHAALNAILAGVGLNVMVVLIVVLLFGKNITQRVKTLAENTRRFGEGKELKAPVGGNDEITTVDTNFREMCQRLEELESVKRNFIAMYSHDVRSPLSSVQVTLELLQSGALGELPATATGVVERAQTACSEMLMLLNNMLNFDRLELGDLPLERTETDLKIIITRSVHALSGLFLKRQITAVVETENITLMADENWLTQVVSNLVSNAIKFSPMGGTISITTEVIDSSVVELRVKDTGPGIPEEEQAKVFERYHQTSVGKKTSAGFGLGLAVCKAVAEAHNGSIGLVSKPGEGCTFWIRLPLGSDQEGNTESV